MCRNIRTLYNFEPPATPEEVHAAAVQFVRKICGFSKPSVVNELAFAAAVDEVSGSVQKLIDSLTTHAAPKSREVEAQKAKERARKRFGR